MSSKIPSRAAILPSDGRNDVKSPRPLSTRSAVGETNSGGKLSKPSTVRARLHGVAQAIITYFKEQWFLIGLGVVITIASQKQVEEAHQDLKQTIVTYLCISIIFLITGCTLPTKVLLANYARWRIHLFVQIQCFLMTSATAFAMVTAAATNRQFMDEGLLVGLILTGVLPTTISSNVVLTRQANGNTALTVVQSTLGNLSAPFIVPLLIKMYTSTGAWYTEFLPTDVNGYGEVYRRVFKQLGLSLFLPLVIGQCLQNLFPTATETVMKKWKLSKVAPFCLLTIIWSIYDQAFQSGAFKVITGVNFVFLVFISIALFILWLMVGFWTARFWLSRKDVVAVCYCVPAKTPAMGIPLVQTIYAGLSRLDQSKLLIPMVIFQGLQIAGGSLLVGTFSWWISQAEEPKLSDGDVERQDNEQPDSKAS